MNLWQKFETKNDPPFDNAKVFLHFEKGVDTELRAMFICFLKWLRKNYVFPTRLNVYVLNCEKVRLINGNMAYGSFRYFPRRQPMIRVPAAIEPHLLDTFSKEEIYEQVLSSLVHELTHYFQWILDSEQSNSASERQANFYRYRIIERFYNEMADAKLI